MIFSRGYVCWKERECSIVYGCTQPHVVNIFNVFEKLKSVRLSFHKQSEVEEISCLQFKERISWLQLMTELHS